MKNQSIQSFDEIIFEHRNKDYGAYQLRKNYGQTIKKSVIYGVSIFLGLVATTYLFAHQTSKDDYTVFTLNPENLPNEKPNQPPIKEEHKPEPPKDVQRKTVEYEPITTVEDQKDIVESPPPNQSDMEGAMISTETNKGEVTDEIFSSPPSEIVAPIEVKTTELAEDNSVFTHVEVNPSFVGGMTEMYRFISKNLQYPSIAQKNNIEGRVVVSFVVEKNGSISSVEILKGIGFGCDEEAKRVVQIMPKWIAGKQNGNEVRVKFTIPLVFKLDN